MRSTHVQPPTVATRSAKAFWANAGLWLIQAMLAIAFLMAGWGKLSGAPEMVALFEQVGGQWFRYKVGILEVGAAVLTVWPSTAAIGAAIIAVVMAGAVLTHVVLIGGSSAPAAMFLLLACVLAWGRWRDRWFA